MTISTLSPLEFADDWVEFSPILESFVLTEGDYEAAQPFADNWSNYTQALVILGFYGWLGDREPTLALDTDPLGVLNSLYSQHLNGVFHLPVNGFKVCILPSLSWSDDQIAVPRVGLELSEFTDQLYIVVGLDEDLGAIAIRGFLTFPELRALTAQISPSRDWNYYLNIDQFHPHLDDLLLTLQCLNPEAIKTPEKNLNIPSLQPYQQSLQERLPLVENRPLWQILTWEESQAIWLYPELWQWLDPQPKAEQETLKKHLADLLNLLIQPAIDLTKWLQNEVEDLQNRTNEGGWQLIPASAFRRHLPLSPATDLSSLLTQIYQETGVSVPSDAGRAYRDLDLGLGVRLYAITWCLSYEDSWTLLLILGSSSGQALNSDIGWRISDQTGILIEEKLNFNHRSAYLFTQLIGTYDEKFVVTLFSTDKTPISLPPFAFPWGKINPGLSSR
ncbi:DUF1822 family protein [Roseofilum sp. BLCC_M154]|uniref:DUF1822 family protein n=1 Tax=Roseofilum acuticapitatum BLCC-M154 TaxID=3022444 RepID=A0ABT7ASI4_9CYAN|nr:DUF1822 family protein [Roseofilum acuticapitatum]MDJ1169835.1 DUF1822 family protein [Roseofilum acuticapitatum BLCC-M154]